MSWIDAIWLTTAGACLTLAAIYLLVWYRNRSAPAHLLFALAAAATAALAYCELWLMRATTAAEVLAAATWVHIPLFVWIVSTTWFVRIRLGAGRLWLAWTICGLRAFSLAGNLLLGQEQSFRHVASVRQVAFLGESVTVLSGAPNRLTPVTQFATLLVLLFVADASITAWRRGDRRQALVVGGSVEFFLIAGLGTASAVVWGNIQMPIAFSLFYVGLVGVMGYELSRDVLRASRLVHELRESEARMSLAVEAADFGIWIRDLARPEVWASDKWRTLFGFAASERVEFDAILKRIHADDLERFQQEQAAALAGGGRYRMEYRITLPDGASRWIASQSRVEFDETGHPVLMRGASLDVTARKHAEAETLRLTQEIAHAGRVSMMGQLAASLVHEINQPLGSILRNAEAADLFLQQPSPDLEEIRAILADIHADDERAGLVIDRMRDLLKRQTLDKKRLDLRALVDDVAALVRFDASTRGVKVTVDVPRDLPPVQGDRVHLQQVMLNLILNGMDALNSASADQRRVSVSAGLDGPNLIEVVVGDTGPGIPAPALAHVFNPFFTTKANGMGMGLAISRTIVEAHGGRIWAENSAGGGAAFRFTLPIAASQPHQGADPA